MFDLNYFKYLLKKNKHAFIYIGIVIVAAFLFPLFGESVIDKRVVLDKTVYLSQFIGLIVIIFGLTFIIPFVNFSHKFNKRAIDLYDALPIKKEKALLTLIVFQAFELIFPFVIAAILGIIMIGGTSPEINNLIGYGIFSIIVVSLINTAIIFKTNSIFDGVVILGAYHILPFVIYAAAYILLSSVIQTINSFPYINNIFYASPFWLFALTQNPDYSKLILVIIQVIYLIIASISLYYDFLNRKPENVEGISNNFFAYRFVINAYLALAAITIASAGLSSDITLTITLFAVLIAVFVFADFIYTRKIRINLRKILKAIVIIIVSIGIVKFVEINKGFGLDKVYPKNYTRISYNLYASAIVKDKNGELREVSINFYDNNLKPNETSIVNELQELQSALADKSYAEVNNDYAPSFYVDYYEEKYFPSSQYTQTKSVGSYNYRTNFEDIKEFIMNPNNHLVFTGDVYYYDENNDFYGSDQYNSFEDLINDYEIVDFGFLDSYEKCGNVY